MGIVKCAVGHFYDDLKSDECPHCKSNAEDAEYIMSSDDERTVAIKLEDERRSVLSSMVFDDEEVTVALGANSGQRGKIKSIDVGEDERTVGIYSSKGSFYPVVGWLVCISGNERGRDYRIISGKNFVGRSYSSDISIIDDPTVTRDKHCTITFDPKSLRFVIIPGDNYIYLNDEQVKDATNMKAYDVITIGQTKLQFVPYCKEGVEW